MPDLNPADLFKQHPVAVSIAIGGVGLIATIYLVRRAQSGSTNTATGIPTDAAGNPITGGLTVSPPLSQSDISTQLQDWENSMQQQILGWEQNFVSNSGGNSGGPVITPVGNPPVGDVGGWSFNSQLREWVYSFGNMFNPTPEQNRTPGGPPPGGGANQGWWSTWWDATIGHWAGKWVMPMQPPPPIAPQPTPVQQIATNPGATGNSVQDTPVYAQTGVWGQAGNPFTTLWYAWSKYGQPHGLNLQTYENDFMQWNRTVSNPNVIQANTTYRVW